MKTEEIVREAKAIRTTQKAQHDRIRKCILMICEKLDELEKASGNVKAPTTKLGGTVKATVKMPLPKAAQPKKGGKK